MTSLAVGLSGDERKVVEQVSDFVRTQLRVEPTGHDWQHAERVRRLASAIAEAEDANLYVVELAALLHDIADFKFTGSDEAGPEAAKEVLSKLDVDPEVISSVCGVIARVSFKGARVTESSLSLEGECVQDADRLDAMGAIGIARTFAYGGFVGRPIHDPEISPIMHDTAEAYRTYQGTTINHFYEKLLLLQGRLKTRTGKALAKRRHAFLLEFLARFEEEWDSIDLLSR